MNAPSDCPAEPRERDIDDARRKAVLAVAHRDLMAEHGADRALGVADRQLDRDRAAVFERVGAQADQFDVEVLLEVVLLRRVRLRRGSSSAKSGPTSTGDRSRPVGLPVVDGAVDVEQLGVADRLVELRKPSSARYSRTSCARNSKKSDDELRLAAEARAQLGVLGRDAHRAGVEVADPHQDAAGHDERCGREAVFLGAEQRAR